MQDKARPKVDKTPPPPKLKLSKRRGASERVKAVDPTEPNPDFTVRVFVARNHLPKLTVLELWLFQQKRLWRGSK